MNLIDRANQLEVIAQRRAYGRARMLLAEPFTLTLVDTSYDRNYGAFTFSFVVQEDTPEPATTISMVELCETYGNLLALCEMDKEELAFAEQQHPGSARMRVLMVGDFRE